MERGPSPASTALDADGRVIYISSFSKTLFPALRLGFLIALAAAIEAARRPARPAARLSIR